MPIGEKFSLFSVHFTLSAVKQFEHLSIEGLITLQISNPIDSRFGCHNSIVTDLSVKGRVRPYRIRSAARQRTTSNCEGNNAGVISQYSGQRKPAAPLGQGNGGHSILQ